MPTPNLYAWGSADPFERVAPEMRSSRAQVLFITDRQPERDKSGNPTYGSKRSRSAAFGVCEVEIGHGVSWEQLVKASRSQSRNIDLEMRVTRTEELGRFEPTPQLLFTAAGASEDGASEDRQKQSEAAFQNELKARLAKASEKEVFIYVHGVANNFVSPMMTVAELWHFFGRNGVPIAYSWPAGKGGLLGYMYDRESSEFTVYHFKHALRLIASCPDVEKIHIVSHSRGTDVLATAIRELHLEIRGSGGNTGDVLKLGTIIMAAPDLDVGVTVQRSSTERLGQIPDRFALYVCTKDKAMSFSNWLFSGLGRLGQLTTDLFTPAEIEALRRASCPQIIDARIADAGPFSHGYFHANPAVSSDLVLLMRYHFEPGAEHGRPLRVTETGFWVIDDSYPGPPRDLSKEAANR